MMIQNAMMEEMYGVTYDDLLPTYDELSQYMMDNANLQVSQDCYDYLFGMMTGGAGGGPPDEGEISSICGWTDDEVMTAEMAFGEMMGSIMD